jgi:hypothetical protein
MRGKLWFLGGAAVGFVIGARAGRERYDQLVRTARRWWDHPTTQEAAGVVQEQATKIYSRGKEAVSGTLGHPKFGEPAGHPTSEPVAETVTRTGPTPSRTTPSGTRPAGTTPPGTTA